MGSAVRRLLVIAAASMAVLPPVALSASGSGATVVALLPRVSAGGFASARVVDSNGHELGRMKLPVLAYIAATGSPHRVLGFTDSDTAYLIDTATHHARRLAASGVLGVDLNVVGGGRYLVLERSTTREAGFLLDTRTGTVVDIGRLGGGNSLIVGGEFSGDGRTLFAVGAQAWLIPTARPDKARVIPRTWEFFAGFSPDGRDVAFVESAHAGSRRLAIEDVDGSGLRELRPDVPSLAFARFLPDGRLLLAGSRSLAVYSPSDGSTRRVAATSGLALYADIAIDGHGAVVGTETASTHANRWRWLDLHGRSKVEHLLNGYTLLPEATPGRYAYFIDNPDSGSGGRRLAVLDLDTGAARLAVVVPRAADYFGSKIAPRARGALVTAFTGRDTRVWLVSGAGTARLIASAGSANASFSPDGGWVALSTSSGGRPPRAQLKLLPVGGGAPRSAGEGFDPVWVR